MRWQVPSDRVHSSAQHTIDVDAHFSKIVRAAKRVVSKTVNNQPLSEDNTAAARYSGPDIDHVVHGQVQKITGSYVTHGGPAWRRKLIF